MASYRYTGIDELCTALDKLSNVPDTLFKDMLSSMGGILKRHIAESAQKAISGVRFISALTLKKPKMDKNGGWSIAVTFDGVRHDATHKKGTREAEIAFINEYGLESHNNVAAGYLADAIEKSNTEAVSAAQAILDNWVKENGF